MIHRTRTLPARLTAALLAAALLAALPQAGAGEKGAPTVGKIVKVDGALLSRAAPGGTYQPIKVGADVPAGVLLVALPDAEILSKSGHVRLKMAADLGKRGPFPVFESAVKFHDNAKFDLDLTHERGAFGVRNMRDKGPATVRVRVHGQTFELVLEKPGTVVGVEVFGRHPPGAPTVAVDKAGKITSKDRPTIELVVIVREGEALLRHDGIDYPLSAPPGPALVSWDSVENKVSLSQLEKLPPSILPTGPEEEKYYKDVCARADRLNKEPIDKVLKEYRASPQEKQARAAAVVYAAIDDLPNLLDCLADKKNADLRDYTVTVLRNWMGREPGQVEQVFATLMKERKYTPVQAKTLVHLLYGPTDRQRREPLTYEVLIGLLGHSKAAVREVARWHLVRLAPTGKKIGFDAAAPEAQRQQAVEQWRALIPAGQLPPRPEVKTPEKK